MLSDVAREGLIANAYNQINTTYTTTLIPDQVQKFNSGIKSSMGRYEANYLSMLSGYIQVMGKSYIFIGREQGLITGDETLVDEPSGN